MRGQLSLAGGWPGSRVARLPPGRLRRLGQATGDVVASAVFKIGRSVGRPRASGVADGHSPRRGTGFATGAVCGLGPPPMEKCQIQALDRTAPILPLQSGPAERRSHDYVRHGTSTLFAALEIATGACKPRHRHQEFLAFLKRGGTSSEATVSTSTRRSCRPSRSRSDDGRARHQCRRGRRDALR
jgi:hypothetical protein